MKNEDQFNPLNDELNVICHLLAILGVHPIFHVSRIRVKRLFSDNKADRNIRINCARKQVYV
jgi:hypothetical protein